MSLKRDGRWIEYATRRDGPSVGRPFLTARYEPGEALGPAETGTLDHFLLERYLVHVERSGRIWTVRLNHRPYLRHDVRVDDMAEDLIAAAGVSRTAGQAPITHYSPAVDVELFRPRSR